MSDDEKVHKRRTCTEGLRFDGKGNFDPVLLFALGQKSHHHFGSIVDREHNIMHARLGSSSVMVRRGRDSAGRRGEERGGAYLDERLNLV